VRLKVYRLALLCLSGVSYIFVTDINRNFTLKMGSDGHELVGPT
jgi:hypothetical protein